VTDSIFSGEQYLRTVFDSFPSPVIVVDSDMLIHDANHAAKKLMADEGDKTLKRLFGDSLHCLYARESEDGCGTTDACPDCVLRQTVNEVTQGHHTFRKATRFTVQKGNKEATAWFLITGAPLNHANVELVILTLEDITELVELRRMLPICSHCHKVRDDADYWYQVEDYLRNKAGMEFTHGICPDCMKEFYPESADLPDTPSGDTNS